MSAWLARYLGINVQTADLLYALVIQLLEPLTENTTIITILYDVCLGRSGRGTSPRWLLVNSIPPSPLLRNLTHPLEAALAAAKHCLAAIYVNSLHGVVRVLQLDFQSIIDVDDWTEPLELFEDVFNSINWVCMLALRRLHNWFTACSLNERDNDSLCTPAGTRESEGGRRLGCRHAQHRGGLQEVFGSFIIVHAVSHKQAELSIRNNCLSGF
jgi:hypothetical protein